MARGNSNFTKVTLNQDKDDYEWLKRTHPESGPAVIIRALVSAYRTATEQKATMLLEDVERLP